MTHRQFASLSSTKHTMGKGKRKGSAGSSSGDGRNGDQKTLRSAVEKAVNEAVNLQDSASDLPALQAAAALESAAQRYREALTRLPGHAEAGYNLATCLSEQADLKLDSREQVSLLRESRAVLESVIEADTSGRGGTTALAHHALGNVIRSLVEVFRDHCPTAPCADCCVGCPSTAECKEQSSQACRHLEASVSIIKNLQNQSGGTEEVLIHWGDAFASMMQMVMDEGSAGRSTSDHLPPSDTVQEALELCSNACSKYSEALALDTSSGGSDTDVLRLKAGSLMNFLDWALPEIPKQPPNGVGFSPEVLLVTGEQTVGMLLGLDDNNVGGLLAKGDLCRLRARVSMLTGAGMQEEGARREESVAWFERAVGGYPQDAEALTTAGEGLLEHGRRTMAVYREVAWPAQGGYGSTVAPAPHVERLRMSAVTWLQDAGNLLSSACAIDTSDTDLPYNAACAFALSGDHTSCFRALSEFCRRLTLTLTIAAAASSGGVSSSKRDAARWSLREVEDDVDLESVREAGWFIDLLRGTNATLVGGP
ncbi:unnamed protein product [Pylaiella littoralis]